MKKYLNDTLKYYDNNFDKYKDIWTDNFLSNYQFDVPDIFLSYLKDKSYILDLGCGTGRDSKYFLEKGHYVKAVDGSKEMCRLAEDYLKIEVEQTNFLDIDFNNEFDGVFACCSLLHLNTEDLISCLIKISKSLKENGVLYASFKYGVGESVVDGRYYNDMTEEKFSEICGFIQELRVVKVWITDQYDSNDKFINFILFKNSEMNIS